MRTFKIVMDETQIKVITEALKTADLDQSDKPMAKSLTAMFEELYEFEHNPQMLHGFTL